jgi:hypothetical protein
MPRPRALPEDAEVAVRAVEPILLKGGDTLKTLSAEFLADVEQDWRQHGIEVLDMVAEKYPQAYFAAMVSLARIIKMRDRAAGRFRVPASPRGNHGPA